MEDTDCQGQMQFDLETNCTLRSSPNTRKRTEAHASVEGNNGKKPLMPAQPGKKKENLEWDRVLSSSD